MASPPAETMALARLFQRYCRHRRSLSALEAAAWHALTEAKTQREQLSAAPAQDTAARPAPAPAAAFARLAAAPAPAPARAQRRASSGSADLSLSAAASGLQEPPAPNTRSLATKVMDLREIQAPFAHVAPFAGATTTKPPTCSNSLRQHARAPGVGPSNLISGSSGTRGIRSGAPAPAAVVYRSPNINRSPSGLPPHITFPIPPTAASKAIAAAPEALCISDHGVSSAPSAGPVWFSCIRPAMGVPTLTSQAAPDKTAATGFPPGSIELSSGLGAGGPFPAAPAAAPIAARWES